MARRVNRAGVELVAGFEGWVPYPYNDAAGHATVGFGHLLHYGRVTAADRARWGRISRTRGLELLEQDLRIAAAEVEQVGRKLNDNQFAALVSFTFNCGTGAFRSSTLRKVVSQNRMKAVRAELMKWTHAGGRTLPGLVRRRSAEADLFERPAKPADPLEPEESYHLKLLTKKGVSVPRRKRVVLWLRARLSLIRAVARRRGWEGHGRRRRAQIIKRALGRL